MHHVPDEVRLLAVAVRRTHVRQRLAREDLLGVEDALLLQHSLRRAPLAYVVERIGLRLDVRGVLKRRHEQVDDPRVAVHVADDLLHEVAIGQEAVGAEDDHYGDLRPDVRQRRDDWTAGDVLHRPRGEHPHVHGGRGTARVDAALYLADVEVLRGRLLGKVVGAVGCHLLLTDDDLFGPRDYEVAAGVLRTLPEVGEISVVHSPEGAVGAAQHDGHGAQEHLGDALDVLLDVAVRTDRLARQREVDVHGGRVRQVPQPRHVGQQGKRVLVDLDVRRLAEVHLPKGEHERLVRAIRGAWPVLVLRDQLEGGRLVDDFLNRVAQELVEAGDLLAHQPPLLKERGHHRPHVLVVGGRRWLCFPFPFQCPLGGGNGWRELVGRGHAYGADWCRGAHRNPPKKTSSEHWCHQCRRRDSPGVRPENETNSRSAR